MEGLGQRMQSASTHHPPLDSHRAEADPYLMFGPAWLRHLSGAGTLTEVCEPTSDLSACEAELNQTLKYLRSSTNLR